jgi:hypothetical protein
MSHSPEPLATVVFACSSLERAQLAARAFAELVDPRRARASAQPLDACTADPRVDLVVAMATHDVPAAAHGRELWPLLDPLHTQGVSATALGERVRQHVVDLVARRGWVPRADGVDPAAPARH